MMFSVRTQGKHDFFFSVLKKGPESAFLCLVSVMNASFKQDLNICNAIGLGSKPRPWKVLDQIFILGKAPFRTKIS